MKSSRRHSSLVPLSREHHYALLVCLRIKRGLDIHMGDWPWLSERAEIVGRFLEKDLVRHFKAEEQILFPALGQIDPATKIIQELLEEHARIGLHAGRLPSMNQQGLAQGLGQFADLLESHIRKEERQLFPLFEQNVDPDLAACVGQAIVDLIGTARQPRHPELLG